MIMENLVTPQEWEMLRSYHGDCIDRIMSECATEAGRMWLLREAGEW